MMIAGHVSSVLSNVKAGFRSLLPVVILIIYTIIGALMFMAIEGPNEKYELEKLHKERAELLEVSRLGDPPSLWGTA